MALIQPEADEATLERAMVYIFGLGVVFASLLVLVGIILAYHSRGNIDLSQSRSAFIHKSNFFRLLNALIKGKNIPTGPLLFVTLGMVALVLTPLGAVAACCVYFAMTKNVRFMLITLVVLTILTVSLAVH